MARSQRAGNLTEHTKGITAKRKEDKTEEILAMKRSQPERNLGYQSTGEVYTIFRSGNGWGNVSALPSDLCTLGVNMVPAVMMTQ